MNPLSAIPVVSDIARAITYPFKMIFVVSLCAFINYFTSPGVWWVQWVAFGMGIALISKWAKAIKTLVGAAVVGGVGYAVYRWFQQRGSKTPATPVNSANTVTTN